jgi:hypothetical protein
MIAGRANLTPLDRGLGFADAGIGTDPLFSRDIEIREFAAPHAAVPSAPDFPLCFGIAPAAEESM